MVDVGLPWRCLRSIQLRGVGLSSLDESMSLIPEAVDVDFSENALQELSTSLKYLKKLEKLTLSWNFLTVRVHLQILYKIVLNFPNLFISFIFFLIFPSSSFSSSSSVAQSADQARSVPIAVAAVNTWHSVQSTGNAEWSGVPHWSSRAEGEQQQNFRFGWVEVMSSKRKRKYASNNKHTLPRCLFSLASSSLLLLHLLLHSPPKKDESATCPACAASSSLTTHATTNPTHAAVCSPFFRTDGSRSHWMINRSIPLRVCF